MCGYLDSAVGAEKLSLSKFNNLVNWSTKVKRKWWISLNIEIHLDFWPES